jgi:hypothetical protein
MPSTEKEQQLCQQSREWNNGKLEKWNTETDQKDYAIRFLIHYYIVPAFHYSNTPFPLSCSRKSANLRWLAIDQRAMAAFDVALDLASSVWLDPSDIFRLNKPAGVTRAHR